MAIPEKWDIPISLRERIGKTIGRQRAMQEEEHTLIMVHQAPSPKEKVRKGTYCWINPKGEFHFYPEGETFEHLFTGYRKKLIHLEHEYENADTALKYFSVLEAIVPLHFSAIRLATALQMSRDLLPTNRQILLWRDESYEIQRESEILQVCTKNALDYHQAKSVEELSAITYKLSKTSHKLNMMATLFVPMMAICGLFGMNVFSGLEHENKFPLFWIIAAFSISLGLGLNFFFRVPKKKEE